MNNRTFQRKVDMPFGYLKIESNIKEYLGNRVLGEGKYSYKFADDCFTISLNTDINHKEYSCYRQEMLAKGIYLGHNIGKPARMTLGMRKIIITVNDGELYDYERLLWSFALKYIITIMSLKWDALHLKGSILIKNGKAVLLLGRGKSGKTTLAKFLESSGYFQCGNTHAIIKDNCAWGINTWIRSRDHRGNQSFDLKNTALDRNAIIKHIIIVDHNNEGRFVANCLNKEEAKAFISFFSAGIGNYDLKEDIFDFNSEADFSKRLNYLVKEQQLVNRLVDNHEILYISSDIENIESRKCLEKFFLEGI